MFKKKIKHYDNHKYNIRKELQDKLDLYDKCSPPKISNCFSWEEFCEVFKNIECVWNLTYNDLDIELFNTKSYISIVTTSKTDTNHTIKDYKSAQDLLQNGKIGKYLLASIWNDIC